jgi:hypothetical protein
MAKYIVTVKNNPNFCGKGAGGVQFANGKAEINSDRMANWFKTHSGYIVESGEAPDTLAGMNKDKLKAYAAEHGIDLTNVPDKKEEILNAIKAAEGK